MFFKSAKAKRFDLRIVRIQFLSEQVKTIHRDNETILTRLRLVNASKEKRQEFCLHALSNCRVAYALVQIGINECLLLNQDVRDTFDTIKALEALNCLHKNQELSTKQKNQIIDQCSL